MSLSKGKSIDKSMNGLLVINASEINSEIATINELDDVNTINGELNKNININSLGTGNINFSGNSNFSNNLHCNTFDCSSNALVNGNFRSAGRLDVSGNELHSGECKFTNRTTILNANYYGDTMYVGSIEYYNPYQFVMWVIGKSFFVNTVTLLDGLFVNSSTISGVELSMLDNINTDENIQSQLNKRLNLITGGELLGNLTVNSIAITPIELSYLSGITSNIQTQLNSKANTSGTTFSGLVYFTSGFISNNFSTFNSQSFFYDKPNLYANLKLNSTAGIEFGSTTLTQTILDYLKNISSDVQTQLNDKVSKTTNSTITSNLTIDASGSLILNGNISANSLTISPLEISFLDGTVTNIQAQLNNKASLSGATFTGNVNFNNTTTTVNSTTLNISASTATNINGTSQFSNSVLFNNTTTILNANHTMYGTSIVSQDSAGSGTNSFKQTDFYKRITLSGSNAIDNKIQQTNIVSGDTAGNPNVFKYSNFYFNSNNVNGSASACGSFIDSVNNNSLLILPNASGGAFNSLVSTNSRAILASGSSSNNYSLVLSGWGSTKNGIAIAGSASNGNTIMQSGGSAISTDALLGTKLISVSQISFSGGKSIDGNYGNIYELSMSNINLTSGVETNLSGSGLSLTAGTYQISWIVGFQVVNGTTTIGNFMGGYTLSPSAFADTIIRNTYNNQTFSPGQTFTLNHSTCAYYSTSFTMHLRCLINFGTANRINFVASLSQLRVIKLT